MNYYKVLKLNGSCCHGGSGVWPENVWMPKLDETKLKPCYYGYHVVEAHDLIHWIGPAIAPVEVHGIVIKSDNKSVVSEAKRGKFLSTWNPRTQRLFAADCAEHILNSYEEKYPNDNRPRHAIETTRKYVDGLVTDKELDVAHVAAARAAYSAATNAAYASAARAAYSAAYSAAANAFTAAITAATNAADAHAARAAVASATNAADAAADYAAAYISEREWQAIKLIEYLEI